MHIELDNELQKKVDLFANNNNARSKSRKGYKDMIEQIFNIMMRVCQKYKITTDTQALNEIEKLFLGHNENNFFGKRFIFAQKSERGIIKAVPLEIIFAIIFSEKGDSLSERIKITINPENFSMDIKIPRYYSYDLVLLTRQIITEMQNILNFSFGSQNPMKQKYNIDQKVDVDEAWILNSVRNYGEQREDFFSLSQSFLVSLAGKEKSSKISIVLKKMEQDGTITRKAIGIGKGKNKIIYLKDKESK